MKQKTKIEIPGIDDCDMLYSTTSRDGRDSVYIRTQEIGGEWYHQISVDSETGHYCEDMGGPRGPFKTSADAARDALPDAREWFGYNQCSFCYCDNLRPIAKKL